MKRLWLVLRGLLKILSYNDEDFQVMVAPHSPYACDEELLKGSLELAREQDLSFISMYETQEENKIILERYGKLPLALLKTWLLGGDNHFCSRG